MAPCISLSMSGMHNQYKTRGDRGLLVLTVFQSHGLRDFASFHHSVFFDLIASSDVIIQDVDEFGYYPIAF